MNLFHGKKEFPFEYFYCALISEKKNKLIHIFRRINKFDTLNFTVLTQLLCSAVFPCSRERFFCFCFSSCNLHRIEVWRPNHTLVFKVFQNSVVIELLYENETLYWFLVTILYLCFPNNQGTTVLFYFEYVARLWCRPTIKSDFSYVFRLLLSTITITLTASSILPLDQIDAEIKYYIHFVLRKSNECWKKSADIR